MQRKVGFEVSIGSGARPPSNSSASGHALAAGPDSGSKDQRSGRPEFRVDLSRNLSAQLNVLTQALDGTGDDLNTILAVLVEDLTAAITSFAGLSITVAVGGEKVRLMAMKFPTAASSLLLPLTPGAGLCAGSHLVLYAQNPGAFIDLAADASRTFDGEVVVDGHLPPPPAAEHECAVADLSQRSTVEQAIGVLIELGYPPGQARSELRRRAAAADINLAATAQKILDPDHNANPQDAGHRGS